MTFLTYKNKLFIFNTTILLASILFLLWIDGYAKNRRLITAKRPDSKTAQIYKVNMQGDVYHVYKKAGLWGAHVVHVNRFLNMLDYFPKEETTTKPFPVQAYDLRPAYESGIDSHNWLFIATRTGLVRRVTVVFPSTVYDERVKNFAADNNFTVSGQRIRGYTYETPVEVMMPESLPLITEPVVINVDAGFFLTEDDAVKMVRILKEKYPDVRAVILVNSTDETDVTAEARENLKLFESAWRNH